LVIDNKRKEMREKQNGKRGWAATKMRVEGRRCILSFWNRSVIGFSLCGGLLVFLI
jgi:hypothetical protein